MVVVERKEPSEHVLVNILGLGCSQENNWVLEGLFADPTDTEAESKGSKKPLPYLTEMHTRGYLDKLDMSCTLQHGQKDH